MGDLAHLRRLTFARILAASFLAGGGMTVSPVGEMPVSVVCDCVCGPRCVCAVVRGARS